MEVSVIIVAKNEEEAIGECLDSVRWADEIVVIDTGSTDRTREIAKKHGAKVFEYGSGGNYSDWRNKGAEIATNKWFLYVDADERVTPSLRDEIIQLTNKSINQYAAYAIPRRNFILGHEMKHGGWWPDYVLRLIKKEALVRWEGKLHEQPIIDDQIGKLKESFIHITSRSLEKMVEKSNRWSDIEAKLLFDSGHPNVNILRLVRPAVTEVFDRLFLKMGFLDGAEGIIVNLFQGWHKLIVYSKLWELQIKKTKHD